MKCVVQFSGGKDSLAALLWAVDTFGKKVIAVFCDTQWEHEFTYQHVDDVIKALGIQLVTLKGKESFIEMAKKKQRFPSPKARFCTEELKVKPFIDWVLLANKHIKDFCEESRHFAELGGNPPLYIHFDVSSWYESTGALTKIERIAIYDNYQEYQPARLRALHSTIHSDGVNLN